MKTFALLLAFLLVSVFSYAQHPAHPDLVASTKAALQAQGVDLSGPCGAFAITRRVAWALRAEGVGLLSKPGGNNCEAMSTDYLVYQDGIGVDILGDAGGANTPAWQADYDPALLGRWVAPTDPGSVGQPPVVTPTPVTPSPVIFSDPAIIQRLMTLENEILIITAEQRQTKAVADQALAEIKAHRAGVQAVWSKVAIVAGPVVTGLTVWLQTRAK